MNPSQLSETTWKLGDDGDLVVGGDIPGSTVIGGTIIRVFLRNIHFPCLPFRIEPTLFPWLSEDLKD
jgi:hypothetical protein